MAKQGEGDSLRATAERILLLLMKADVEGSIGAVKHERNAERTTWPNA